MLPHRDMMPEQIPLASIALALIALVAFV